MDKNHNEYAGGWPVPARLVPAIEHINKSVPFWIEGEAVRPISPLANPTLSIGCHVNTNTTASAPTQTIDQVRKFMADFDAKYPRAHRAVRIECRPGMFEIVRFLVDDPTSRHRPLGFVATAFSMCSIPLECNHTFPSGCYLLHMADGSSTMVYRGGRKVRCLP